MCCEVFKHAPLLSCHHLVVLFWLWLVVLSNSYTHKGEVLTNSTLYIASILQQRVNVYIHAKNWCGTCTIYIYISTNKTTSTAKPLILLDTDPNKYITSHAVGAKL